MKRLEKTLNKLGFEFVGLVLSEQVEARFQDTEWYIYITGDYSLINHLHGKRDKPLLFVVFTPDEEFTEEDLRDLEDSSALVMDEDKVCTLFVPEALKG